MLIVSPVSHGGNGKLGSMMRHLKICEYSNGRSTMVQISTCLPIVYSGGLTDKFIVEKAVRSKRFTDLEHIKTHQGGC